MSDQCKHCTHRGDYEACNAETCFRHESWIDLERIRRIEELEKELREERLKHNILKIAASNIYDRSQELEKDALEMATALTIFFNSYKWNEFEPFYDSEAWERWGPRAGKEQDESA